MRHNFKLACEGGAGGFNHDRWIIRAARDAVRARRERTKLFGSSLFYDPAWDVLLHLFLADDEGRGVTVTEACHASSVPISTALRRIGHLVDRKLIVRVSNPKDRRAVHLYLTAYGRKLMLEFFGKVPMGTGANAR